MNHTLEESNMTGRGRGRGRKVQQDLDQDRLVSQDLIATLDQYPIANPSIHPESESSILPHSMFVVIPRLGNIKLNFEEFCEVILHIFQIYSAEMVP